MLLTRTAGYVIFDMDGVLLDTEPYYTEVTQRIVGRYGKTFDWSVKGNMVGRPAIESARHLVQALDLPITAEEYLRERAELLERLVQRCEPMDGARELTAALAALDVPQVVATSSDSRMVELKTRRHREWFRVFTGVIAGDDPRIDRGKPAPDIFLVAALELGAGPEECVVIEDSPAGIAAAHTAGMQAVAVPDPAMDPARFAEAEIVVRSLTELSPPDLGFSGRGTGD